MDEFSAKREFLISIGGHKASILFNVVEKEAPKTIVELGGYLGYSAILFADVVRRRNNSSEEIRVWSLELNSEFASIAREMIDLAGLSDVVTVVVGTAETSLQQLTKDETLKSIDLLFLDHEEELYVPDFKTCQELNLLKRGSIIIADNVVRPGAPEYRALVRSSSDLKSHGITGFIQPADLEVSDPMKS
jgi:catechol O-methyltransferase